LFVHFSDFIFCVSDIYIAMSSLFQTGSITTNFSEGTSPDYGYSTISSGQSSTLTVDLTGVGSDYDLMFMLGTDDYDFSGSRKQYVIEASADGVVHFQLASFSSTSDNTDPNLVSVYIQHYALPSQYKGFRYYYLKYQNQDSSSHKAKMNFSIHRHR
jgi:hypothetical protein